MSSGRTFSGSIWSRPWVITAGGSAGLGQSSSKAGDILLARILTGLVGIPLFLGLLYLGKWPLLALVAGMGLIGFHEYTRMWRVKGIQVPFLLGGAATLATVLWAGLVPANGGYLGAILSATAAMLLSWVLFRYEERTIVDGLVTLAGVLYVGFLLSHLLLLRGLGEGTGWDLGLKWVSFAFFCTWAADTFAYFVGVAIGRRKLAPKISPGKSVEGVLGGSLGAVIVGFLWAPVIGIAAWQGALIGLVISFISVLGDLTESALKRHAGVKDSGNLLPGHGGVLDRFDSSLFVLPFVYYIATLLYGLS
ncbi:MAG: phosphatidate cytidylyltransferase [Bacillota bacterium]